jgi:hypothetical protein
MFRIKDLHYGTLKAFHSKNLDFRKVEKDREHNDAIITRLFNDTLSGKIKGFYLISDEYLKAYHRSPKKPGHIQQSVGFYKNGELYPTYDLQFKTAKEAIKEGYNSGFYEIIA